MASPDRLLAPLAVGGHHHLGQPLDDLHGELWPVAHQPLQALPLDDEELDVADRHRRGRAGRFTEQTQLSEQLALVQGVEDPLGAIEALANLDGPAMDDVGLGSRLVTLAENELAGSEAPALDVAEGEVLVNLQPDRGQVGLRLHGQARIRPAAEAAFEDADVAEPLLP